jgi:hypothetical protein
VAAKLRINRPAQTRKHQRNRHSRRPAGGAPPRAAEAALALRVASAGLERRVEIDARRAYGRRQAEQHAGDDRHAEREREHGPVEPDRVDTRNVPGVDGADDTQREEGDAEPGHAAEQAEHEALGEQLRRQPRPSRAERGAHGDFLLPAAARQQEGRDAAHAICARAPPIRAARARAPHAADDSTS